MCGIDYGNGQTNIDTLTGIRFGVIPASHTLVWDEAEPYYGEPTCPVCFGSLTRQDRDYEQYKNGGCSDLHCDKCKLSFDNSDALPEDPLSHFVDTADLKGSIDEDGDLFVLKSPYYTTCKFCSPCAPGAGYLLDYITDGVKTYCPGPDRFENGEAPFPIWLVEDDSPVFSPKNGKVSSN